MQQRVMRFMWKCCRALSYCIVYPEHLCIIIVCGFGWFRLICNHCEAAVGHSKIIGSQYKSMGMCTS